MEDWDIPDPQDDFENQYADELEMLDEMGEEINDRKYSVSMLFLCWSLLFRCQIFATLLQHFATSL